MPAESAGLVDSASVQVIRAPVLNEVDYLILAAAGIVACVALIMLVKRWKAKRQTEGEHQEDLLQQNSSQPS